jgi:RNA polymerase sigma factor (sigma-70 family)
MEYLTDQEILEGCIAGNRRALEAFVRRFSDFVYRSVQHALIVKDIFIERADLEELHNTVFVKLLEKRCRKLRQYKGKRGCSLLSWIRLITVRIVIDNLRKKNTDVLTRRGRIFSIDVLLEVEGETPEPWALMDKEAQTYILKEGIRNLVPRDQLLLKLHFMEERPIREVAGIMRISEENAHTLKHRVIKRLRAVIAKNDGLD